MSESSVITRGFDTGVAHLVITRGFGDAPAVFESGCKSWAVAPRAVDWDTAPRPMAWDIEPRLTRWS